MKTLQYKDQNNKNYKIIELVFFVMIFILLLGLIFLLILKNNITKENEGYFDQILTIKDVVIKYGNKYISEENNPTPGYEKNVYLELNTLPYDGEKSNEQYYNDFLNDLAGVQYFNNYFLIDKKNGYNIEVLCKDYKVYKIIINGIEDYFIYMDSEISMKNYEEIPTTNIEINSPIINELISTGWDKKINLGTRESIFDKYYIYFDEGIKSRTIQDDIFNVVFDKRYNNPVVNGITPGVDIDTIKAKMGEPAFYDKENNIVGYKNNYIYVFFTENEISLYRNLDTNIDDFYSLADKYINKSMNFKEFMNELTYMWPDYSDYVYDSRSVFLSYPLKGIEIKLNYDDISGILVYNNIKSILPKVQNYLKNSSFIARLKLDSVFEVEKRRVIDYKNLIEESKKYKDSLSVEDKRKFGESFEFEIIPTISKNKAINKIRFISRHNEYPNRELNDRVDDYLWASKDKFIYSKQEKGIYMFDLSTGIINRIVSGNEEYRLNELKDNILKYDDKKEVLISY